MSNKIVKLAEDTPGASEDEWRRLAEAGLRTRSLADVLDQKSRSGFVYPVLATGADRPEGAGALVTRAAPRWDIGSRYVLCQDPRAINRAILADLAGGATSISIDCAPDDLATILTGVQLDMAAVHLDAGGDFDAAAAALKQLWADDGAALESVSGSFGAEPAAEGEGMAAAVALASEAARETPRVATFRVSAGKGGDELAQLAGVLKRTIRYAEAMQAAGMSPADAFGQIRILLPATAEQFLTIAKFRALHLVLARVAEVTGLSDNIRPQIDALVEAKSDSAAGAGCVEAAVAALAAAVAGADAIVVPELTGPTAEDEFRGEKEPHRMGRRLARNIQHLLAEESRLGFVADPAAGSFAIERMTHDMARRAWELWQSGGGEEIAPSASREAAR